MNSKPISLSQRLNNTNSIREFNENIGIRRTIETIIGEPIKGKFLRCPIHGGDNKTGASINEGKNLFKCHTHGCGGKALDPWGFVSQYYGIDNSNYLDMARKINQVFNYNLPILEKNEKKVIVKKDKYEEYETLYIERYASEVVSEIKKNKSAVIEAGTGYGKTRAVIELIKHLDTRLNIFIVPNRSLAEQVSKEYGFSLFYKNDTELPDNKNIVCTVHKAPRLQEKIESIIEYDALLGRSDFEYSVIVDECHEMISNRNNISYIRIKALDELIRNADYRYFLSANTIDFHKCFKGRGYFNKAIRIVQKKQINSIDNLSILRQEGSQEAKTIDIVNNIVEQSKKHDYIFCWENNKNNLERYKRELEIRGIQSTVINSDNKNDDDVIEEYESIIDVGRLRGKVVFCTSVINAGVSIKNKNVCSIAIMRKQFFDSNKVIQFLGRIRSVEGNEAIIFLDKPKHKVPFIQEFNTILENMINSTKGKVNEVMSYYFSEYGEDIDNKTLLTDWNFYKQNKGYKDIGSITYVEDSTIKIDYISLYEDARLKYENVNYNNDIFIIELFKGSVKANKMKIKVVECEEVEKPKEDKEEKISFQESLKVLNDDKEGMKQLYSYLVGNRKKKDIDNDTLVNFIDDFNTQPAYKKFKKRLIAVLEEVEMIGEIQPFKIMKMVIAYYSNLKPKQAIEEVTRIERQYIYNHRFRIGVEPVSGDIYYDIVRSKCDCFIGSGNSVCENKSIIGDCVELFCKKNKGIVTQIEKKGKKNTKIVEVIKYDSKDIKLEEFISKTKKALSDTYDISSKGFIKGIDLR